MGILICEGAVTVEGPPAQGVNRDIPSGTQGSGGCDSLLEVWLEAYFSFFLSYHLLLFHMDLPAK